MLAVIGIALITFGVYARLGGNKRLYVIDLPTVAIPEAYRNAFIPLGLSFALLGLSLYEPLLPSVELRRRFAAYIVLPAFVISIVLGIWRPRWLKPRWLVYLEDTYDPVAVYGVLFPIANKNIVEWEQKMRTLEDIKRWAAEVAEEQDLPAHYGREDREALRRQRAAWQEQAEKQREELRRQRGEE